MDPWPEIPDDVIAWFRNVFAEANRRVCERLVNLPNVRETSLDDGLVEALIPDTAPTLLSSGAIVRMDKHNIGGLRRLGWPGWPPWDLPYRRRWETADIAILVFIYRHETLIAKKVGLLQSKRLYPDNNDVEEDDETSFRYGMNAFLRREDTQAIGVLYRQFSFNDSCVYGSINAGSDQIRAIETLNQNFGKVVYYLLYNPNEIPLSVSYPLSNRIRIDRPPHVGCRVHDADHMHRSVSGLSEGQSPTYAMMSGGGTEIGWSLETWAADLLLTCQVGDQFDDSRDEAVRYFLERRSGPIGAALAVSITLPEGFSGA